jgi:hypothetical protein
VVDEPLFALAVLGGVGAAGHVSVCRRSRKANRCEAPSRAHKFLASGQYPHDPGGLSIIQCRAFSSCLASR